MKTQSYFLILLTFFPWILEAQPLADLSGMRVGDSVLVEVNTLIKKEHANDSGEKTFKERCSDDFLYSLVLLEKSGDEIRFRGTAKRYKSSSGLVYRNDPNHKRSEKSSFDSRFDTGDPGNGFMSQMVGKTFEIIVNIPYQRHTLLIGGKPANKKIVYFGTLCNSGGINNHINALFFAQNYPIQGGSIRARIVEIEKPNFVHISGKIENAFSNILTTSSNSPSIQIRYLSPLSNQIQIDDDGNFEANIMLDKPSHVYLFHELYNIDAFSNTTKRRRIHVYLEPGDSLQFRFDTQDPEGISFYGPQAPKFKAFHDFHIRFPGYYVEIDKWLYKLGYYMKGVSTNRLSSGFKNKNQEEFFSSLLNYLEEIRKDLGDPTYYAIKSELVYNYAMFKLTTSMGENLHSGSRIFSEEKPLSFYHLTLSEDKDFYLEQLGLRLKEVEASYSYSNFLAVYIAANSSHLKKQNMVAGGEGLLSNYYLARFTFQGFALNTYLKNYILTWLDRQTRNSFRNLLNEDDVMKGRKLILSQFKELCKYEPYLRELENAERIYKNLEQGKTASNLRLSERSELKDYFGQKLALVFFRKLEDPQFSNLNDLARDNPAVKFIFINIFPSQDYFKKLGERDSFEGDLYHSPGYGSNRNRPYFVDFGQSTFFLIDQEGKMWGSEESRTNSLKFEQEVRKLTTYEIDYVQRFWENYKSELLLISLSFCVFFILWSIYWFFFIRNKRIQQNRQNQRIETELRAIRSQMNPHFLFNSLSSVQNLINQAEPEKANHYLSRFSQLVRKVLNHSEQALIPLEEELKVVDLYCELEALRFKFDYKIEVDQGIDAHTMEIPSMLIQPYVENSVRHGLATQGGAGFIGVFVRKKEELIQIEIIDNGIGIRKHMEDFAGHVKKSGFGLRLSEERVQKINERYKMDIEVKIFDRRDDQEPSHGTRVVIKIPIEK